MIKFLFRPWNGHTNYVKVVKRSFNGACYSKLGMMGGEQELSLGLGNEIRVCQFRCRDVVSGYLQAILVILYPDTKKSFLERT